MVFEKMGSNLLSLIKLYRYEGIPIPIVKVITKQILIALDYVDKCGITHTDLKPENVLLQQQIHLEHNRSSGIFLLSSSLLMMLSFYCLMLFYLGVLSKKSRDELSQQINLTPENCKVFFLSFNLLLIFISFPFFFLFSFSFLFFLFISFPFLSFPSFPPSLTLRRVQVCLADFGNATWADAHFTNDVQTAEYRSPEVILGGQWDGRVDVWALVGTHVFVLTFIFSILSISFLLLLLLLLLLLNIASFFSDQLIETLLLFVFVILFVIICCIV